MLSLLEHALERQVLIVARRATVFRFFSDARLWATWWGPGSTIDPRPGGALRIQYPGNVVALGEVLELEAESRIVFSYGYEDESKGLPPGGSRVTITLEERAAGTLVVLRHELHDAAARDHHVQGWRHQLALFANLVAAEQQGSAADVLERWFVLWAEPDGARRRAELLALASPDIVVHDAFSCLAGHEDVLAHIAAVQIHMPGVRLQREGQVRQCQGTALCDWSASGPDGSPRGRGTNVVDFAPDGRIARIVGLWGS